MSTAEPTFPVPAPMGETGSAQHHGADWALNLAPDRMSSMSISTTGEPLRKRPEPQRTGAASRPRRSLPARVLGETGYVLAAFPLSLLALPIVAAMFSVGLGLSVTVIGLPLLALAGYVARTFALINRRLIRNTLQADAASPVYRRDERGLLRRALTTLGDPQTWLDILYGLFGFILATISFVLTVVWWTLTLGGLSWVLWGWSLPNGPNDQDVPELIGLGDSYLIKLAWYTVIGLLALLTLPWVVRAAAWITAGPALLLLSSRAHLQAEIEYQVQGRQAARTAEASSLRKLERDIHDGPQQRLVRLSMDLGRARKQVDADPEQARATLQEAIGQTRATLDELRALSRGIAPPVLADRGLTAALEEVVARSTIPVHLTMQVPAKMPEHVETAAYFVVSEALTNVAKHAGAEYALVDLTVHDSPAGRMLTITVSDNGVGGAQLSKGHGLVGLADRVRGVDGVLNLTSPTGGPTDLVAEIPC